MSSTRIIRDVNMRPGGPPGSPGWSAKAGAFLRTALRSFDLVPFGWTVSVHCCRTNPGVVLSAGGLISAGMILQWYFNNAADGQDVRVLLVASLLWQAAMAAAMAALVVPVHLFVIDNVLPPRDESAGPGASRAFVAGPSALMMRAAVYGLAIWLITYLAGTAAKAMIVSAYPATQGITYYFMTAAHVLIAMHLSVVRPALSLGLARPLRWGVEIGLKHALPLYLMTGLLLAVPALVGPLLIVVPHGVLHLGQDAPALSMIGFVVFSVFQMLAAEAALLAFMCRAIKESPDVVGPEREC